MAGVFLAGHPTPVPLPPAYVSSWPGIAAMTWTGWDGSVWDLLTGASGIALVNAGVRGLNMPPVKRFTSSAPSIAGSRWKGSQTGEREAFWPIFVSSIIGSEDWFRVDAAFWDTMHPDLPGVWSVTQPSGETRTLRCRFADDGGQPFESDPSRQGVALYGVTLIAERPYWQGAAIERTWKAGTPTPFFGGVVGASGPPFFISSGSTLGAATMLNTGNVAAYPVWTLVGPWTSASLGVGGSVVVVPFAGALGESLTIDTHPDALTAVDGNGLDRTSELGSSEFTAIGPGVSVPLSLTMVGTGMVSISLIPLHFRAW